MSKEQILHHSKFLARYSIFRTSSIISSWTLCSPEFCFFGCLRAFTLSLRESRAVRPGEGNPLSEYFMFGYEKKPYAAAIVSNLLVGQRRSGFRSLDSSFNRRGNAPRVVWRKSAAPTHWRVCPACGYTWNPRTKVLNGVGPHPNALPEREGTKEAGVGSN